MMSAGVPRAARRTSLVVAVIALLSLFVSTIAPATTVADSDAGSIPAVNPVRLRVPAAGISAPVQDVGTTDDGSMDVPSNFTDVAWFAPGYRPGEYGHAVFDGHVSNVESEAVFFYVEDLLPGATIYVTGDDGTVLSFRVTMIESYPMDGAPMDDIFGPSDWPQLVLITCGGAWHEDIHLFDHRTVVFSSLISVDSP